MSKNLKEFNTFAIDASCNEFKVFSNENQLAELFSSPISKWMVLGGGSNILFTKDYNGTIIHPLIKGIEQRIGDEGKVCLSVGAGETWDDLCGYAAEHNLWGIENLSGIPGNVGASPVQNIGAYGCEAGDTLKEVRFFDTHDKTFKTISGSDCKLAYRNSIFKTELKEIAIITYVVFELSTTPSPNLGYGALSERVEGRGGATLENIRNSVIEIRDEKLPDPKKLGNGGSFFKNPIVSSSTFNSLQKQYQTIAHYKVGDDYKIPAAWLIEHSGWKGRRVGLVGVHTTQPLVLVNYGGATGNDVLNLSEHIVADIYAKFSITLEREINVV
ncbi:MAG: UDP-N-acetylmuramate dehydrogenase [Rikenellaceae bacterium]